MNKQPTRVGLVERWPWSEIRFRRSITARPLEIAHNTTWYAPRRPLVWTLEDLPQSDLYRTSMRLPLFHGAAALRTRRASKKGQRRDDRIGRDNGVISNLGAVLDDCEFPLRKQTIVRERRRREIRQAFVFTITQFFPISTLLPMVAASTMVLAPM